MVFGFAAGLIVIGVAALIGFTGFTPRSSSAPRVAGITPGASASTTAPPGYTEPAGPNVNNHGIVEPVRHQGTAVIGFGQVIDVESQRHDWALAEAPSGSPENLEFTQAHRTVEGINPAVVGVLPAGSAGTRRECGSLQAYGDPVPPEALQPGLLVCEITGNRRYALLRCTDVQRDTAGVPVRLTFDITTWEPQDAS